MIVVVMGVAGAGKSTVGRALAARLGWPFVEADELHPRRNVDKMARGEPLDDADRAPWLAALAARLRAVDGDAVVACSALKAAYRDALRVTPDVRFVLLDAPAEVLAARLAARKGHFMPPTLLGSQLATLERTPELVVVDGTRPLPAIVATILARL